jgi:hypothetical protein
MRANMRGRVEIPNARRERTEQLMIGAFQPRIAYAAAERIECPVQGEAVPMIGGMISSTILTLIVIPAIYGLVKGWRLQPARETESKAAAIGTA